MGGSEGKLKNGEDAAQKQLEHVSPKLHQNKFQKICIYISMLYLTVPYNVFKTLEHKFIRVLFEKVLPDNQIAEMVQTCLSKMKKHTYKEPAQLATLGLCL